MINTYFENDTITGKSLDRELIRFLWGYVRKYKTPFYIGILLSLVTSVLVILGPYLIAQVIDRGIEPGVPSLILKFGLMLLVVHLLHFFVFGIQMYITQIVGARVVHDLRVDLFRHIQRLRVSYFDKNPVGRIVTRLTNDVTAVGELFSEGAVMMLFNVIFVIGVMVFILLWNWRLGLISLSTFPVLCFIGIKVAVLLRGVKRVVREKIAVINSFLSEHIAGMKVVNMFSREEQSLRRFKQINDGFCNAQIRQAKVYALLMPSVTVLMGISIALILFWGGSLVVNRNLTIGALVAFISYIEWIMHPLRDMIERYNVFLQSSTATERLLKISLMKEEYLPDETDKLDQVEGEVEFRDVHFRYDETGDSEVLKGVSFRISPGECIAIVGETGSGKTTILNLIKKFYLPQSGKILIDGFDLRFLDRENLRSFVGVIDQNVHVFSGTIKENVTPGRDISEEALGRALEISNCSMIVKKYRDGLNHMVAEGGKNLSSGERQLISFARMVAYDPSILIMDEATSNIDSENEEHIIDAIAKITEGKTSIIVAHRLSTVKFADRIFVVDSGRIIESGTHKELVRAKGRYASLYAAMMA